MQSLQTEKPRIENQFNQPLSISVIFLPSLFHQLPPPQLLACLLALGFLIKRGKIGCGGRLGEHGGVRTGFVWPGRAHP